MRTAIRRLRKDRDLTLEQLAEKTGYAVSTLSNLENGRFTASEDLIDKLSKAFNISAEEMRAATAITHSPATLREDVTPYRVRRSLANLPDETVQIILTQHVQALPQLSGDERAEALQEIIAHAHELLERARRPKILDRGGNPLSSKLGASMKEGAKRGAAKGLKEMDHENPKS
jgi:transcriptional regulator with XRE-family HTH domain